MFVQRDDVIHQLTANTADPAFSNSVCGRMFRAVEVQNSSSAVFNEKEAVKRSKVQRWNRKEVEGGDDLAVIVQKRQPSFCLALVMSAPDAFQVA